MFCTAKPALFPLVGVVRGDPGRPVTAGHILSSKAFCFLSWLHCSRVPPSRSPLLPSDSHIHPAALAALAAAFESVN